MTEPYRGLILGAFPRESWQDVVNHVEEGIAAADREIGNNPLLTWPVGKDQRGDLRRVGVMRSLHDACARRELPLFTEVKRNQVGNCHHIEMIAGAMCVHVNQTGGPSIMPSDTPLRNDKRLANQGDLFADHSNVIRLDAFSRYYMWLTFGADTEGRLTHVCAGMPCDRGNRWLDRINLLTELRLTGMPPIIAPKQAPAATPAKPVFGLKSDVRKDLEEREEKNNGRKDQGDGSNG